MSVNVYCDKGGRPLIGSPESHLIILRTDIVVFFHLSLNGKEDRPCHIVPPYSRHSVSKTFLQWGLYTRSIPALWPKLYGQNTRVSVFAISFQKKGPTCKRFYFMQLIEKICKCVFLLNISFWLRFNLLVVPMYWCIKSEYTQNTGIFYNVPWFKAGCLHSWYKK